MKSRTIYETFLHCIVGLIILLGSSTTYADALLDRVTQDIDIGDTHYEKFRLDIDEVRVPMNLPNTPFSPTRYTTVENVHIVCLLGCSPHVKYSEQFDDVPIAAFVLFDGSQDFITLWSTRRGYAIRVYHVERGSITKDLDEASVTPPQVEAVDYGTVVVTVINPDLAARLKLSSNAETWRSNGASFQMMPAN